MATLLLLQSRGTATAAEVALELEVSERTARRDLDALAMSGIPLYSKQGRGGGWTLVGGATTDLTGLRSPEARALMTMVVATGRSSPEFSSAIRKITQALPAPVRAEVELIMASTVTDSTSWGNRSVSLLHEPSRDEWLDPLQLGVIEHRRIALTYDTPRKGTSRRMVDPLGLVVKQGRWYVFADTDDGRRSFRVDRIVDVESTPDRFEPPDDFDVEQAWHDVTQSYSDRVTPATVEVVVSGTWIPALRALGVEAVIHGPAGEGDADRDRTSTDDRFRATLAGFSFEALAVQISGVMVGIELIDPPDELVVLLGGIGNELVTRFGAR